MNIESIDAIQMSQDVIKNTMTDLNKVEEIL